MASMAQPTQTWMVRTHDNWIAGPYSADQVKALIAQGKLLIQDEICPVNGYWFYLHESSELKKHLGVEVPRSSRNSANLEDEITDTETQVAVGPPELALAEEDLASLNSEDTKVLSNRALREFRPAQKQAGAALSPRHLEVPSSRELVPAAPRVHVRGVIEKPQAWRYFAFALLAAAGALVYWVLDILRR